MAAPNRHSVAILGQMLDEFKRVGFARRVGTHSFANQLRGTLAAMRKNDEGWWSVKLRVEEEWNAEEGKIQAVVLMLAQDTYRGPKTNRPEKPVEALMPATSYGLPTPQVAKAFAPPNDMEWRGEWNWNEEFQGRVQQGEDVNEIRRHIEWKKEQVNDPAKRKEYFNKLRRGIAEITGQDPGEQDPRLKQESNEKALVQAPRSAKTMASQELFDTFFKPKPLD